MRTVHLSAEARPPQRYARNMGGGRMALRMHKRRTLTVMAGAVAVALVASALWRRGRRAAAPARHAGANARGPITYVRARTTAASSGRSIDEWNEDHPDEKVTFKEQTDEADQQHDDLVQHFQAQDAELRRGDRRRRVDRRVRGEGLPPAARGRARHGHRPACSPATSTAASYNGTLYAAPTPATAACSTTAPICVKTPAGDLGRDDGHVRHRQARTKSDCYAGQFQKYEGLP